MYEASRTGSQTLWNGEIREDHGFIDRKAEVDSTSTPPTGGHGRTYSKYQWDGSAIERDRVLGRLHSFVYQMYAMHPDSTDREIWENVLEKKYRFNALAGRRNEMRMMGFIECSGRRHCLVSGKLSKTWRVVPPTKE